MFLKNLSFYLSAVWFGLASQIVYQSLFVENSRLLLLLLLKLVW